MAHYTNLDADDLWQKITHHVNVMLYFNNVTPNTIDSMPADTNVIMLSTRLPVYDGSAPQEAIVFARNGRVYFTLEAVVPGVRLTDPRPLLDLSVRPGDALFASHADTLSAIEVILGRMERELLDMDVLRTELCQVPVPALVAESEKVPYTGLSDVFKILEYISQVYAAPTTLALPEDNNQLS